MFAFVAVFFITYTIDAGEFKIKLYQFWGVNQSFDGLSFQNPSLEITRFYHREF